MELFHRFLKQISVLITATLESNIHRQLLHEISQDLDFKLPFRIHAPSLHVALNADPGPFSQDHIRTRSGFFSALLFRALTFSAPIVLEDEQVFFQDYDDWLAFYKQATDQDEKPVTYFVRNRAYGTPNKHRNPSITESLWFASEVWEEWLDSNEEDGSICPVELFTFLMGQSPCKAKFRNVGPLTAYLLTADYICAGLATMPSVEQMAHIIHSVNKGAVSGLRMLGLLPRGVQAVTGHDVSVATSQLWKYLESSLSDDLKEKMPWNVITLEHSLCKFSRLGISDSRLNA